MSVNKMSVNKENPGEPIVIRAVRRRELCHGKAEQLVVRDDLAPATIPPRSATSI